MTIEEFLEANVYNLTPAEYNQALADLDSLDANAWIKKHSALMQEKTTGWNKVDEVKRSKPLANRIKDAFADSDFNPGKNFKQDVYEADFSDVPREKFEEALSKMKQYYDEEVDARDKEYLKEKRKQEVKDWNFLKDMATSDYEKMRYIEDPQSALFGEQAPSLGDAPTTRSGAIADLGLGVAGAAGDMLPGWGSMAGPALRTFRDIGHKVTDSPYQKELKDIVLNSLTDASATASTAWLPNFRKQQRMLGKGGMMPGDIGTIVGIENESKNIVQGSAMLLPFTSDKLPITEETRRDMLRKAYANMPESQLKQEIAPLMTDPDIDWSKLKAIITNNLASAQAGTTKQNRNAWRQMFNAKDPNEPIYKVADNLDDAEKVMVDKNSGELFGVKPMTKLDPLSQRILEAEELTKTGERLKPVFKAADNFLGSNLGGAILQASKTATGKRRPIQPERIRTAEEQAAIDDIKMSEARFWEAGFKPNKVEGDPLWEAYQEWEETNKKKNLIKKNLLGGK